MINLFQHKLILTLGAHALEGLPANLTQNVY